MRYSYSALSTYEVCPMQFKFKYVEELPSAPSAAISFGRSLHEALRWFYDVPTPDPRTLDELIDYLEICWESEGYSTPEEEAKYFYHAKSVLQTFYRNNAGDFRIPLALEHRFNIDLGFCELSGIIDRLDKRDSGEYEIIDYKTNRRLPPASKLNEDLQLPIYHMAAVQTWEINPDLVTFYYLIPSHRHTIKVTDAWLEKALLRIKEIVTLIEREEYSPAENNLCPWCDYLDLCPLMSGRFIRKKSPEAPEMEIGQAVDELLLSRKRLANMVSRIEGLETSIRSYLARRNLPAVSGSIGVAKVDERGNVVTTERHGLHMDHAEL